jgi:hypothetical protein
MKYSAIFKAVNYRVDVLVDNATTHTKALVDVSIFNKSIDTHCGVNKLYWINENNEECYLDCFYQSGPNLGLSKGLFNICKELKIIGENVEFKKIKFVELLDFAAPSIPTYNKTGRFD